MPFLTPGNLNLLDAIYCYCINNDSQLQIIISVNYLLKHNQNFFNID